MFKFQLGGSFDDFFSVFNPVPIRTSSQTSSSSESRSSRKKSKSDDDDSGKLTEKEFYKLISLVKGLPAEATEFMKDLQLTIRISKVLGKDDIEDMGSLYLNCVASLTNMQFNQDRFDKTYERAVAQDNLNDIAISTSGRVIVMDELGLLSLLLPSEWVEVRDSGEYSPVTNSNLLWMRANMPLYKNNNFLFLIVENGIGLLQIHKLIKDSIIQLGNGEQSSDFFVSKDVIAGTEELKKMMEYGPDGYYKISLTKEGPDSTLIKSAINYIYTMLPANAKARLAIETKNGTLEEVWKVIEEMILGTVKTKYTLNGQYVGSDEKLFGTSNGKGSELLDNIATKLIKGEGALETFEINLGNEEPTIVSSIVLPLVGKEDKQLGVRSPISKLSESSIGNILNFNSMSMAGVKVNAHQLNHFITEDAKLRVIDYPCEYERGMIKPSISGERLERKDKADEELKKMNIDVYNIALVKANYLTINDVYRKHQLSEPYNSDGSLNSNYYHRFVIMSVSTDEREIPGYDKSLVREATDSDRLSIISAIEDSDKNYSPNNSFMGMGGSKIYTGLLWIPYYPSYVAATATDTMKISNTDKLHATDLAIKNRTLLTEDSYE